MKTTAKLKTLIAFHGDKAIKERYLDRVKAHYIADEIIKGTYWENGKGCAVGCTVHSSRHTSYEIELGIPRILARLEDGIFESLENGRAKEWPVEFLSAIPVGADLSNIWPQFAIWLMVDKKWGVLQFAKTDAVKDKIEAVAKFYRAAKFGDPKSWGGIKELGAPLIFTAAEAAYAYAAAAAYAAATAAGYAAAAGYADAAGYAAAAAAAYDADAAYTAVYEAVKEQWREAQADKLLELLKKVETPTDICPICHSAIDQASRVLIRGEGQMYHFDCYTHKPPIR